MACGCSKRSQVATLDGGGYYVVLPDGSEKPAVSAGAAPLLSAGEARKVVTLAGGGTIRIVKPKR